MSASAEQPTTGRVRRWTPRILLTLALGLALLYGGREWPRLWLFDLYQRISPAQHDASQITIVDIDGESVRQLGRWPWPRDRLARIIDRVRAARVIGLDILLLDPDRTPGDPDADLATAMSQARVVLAATRDEAAPTQVIAVTPILQVGAEAPAFAPGVSQIAWPIPTVQRAASGTGLALLL